METSRAKLKFSWGSQETQCYIRVRLALLPRRDAWAFWPLFSGGSEPASSSPCPPGFTDVSEGWCHWKSDHKQVGCYCIWKPSTFGSSTLTSKIKRIPLFQQLSWLFAYVHVCWVLGIVTWEDDIVLGGFIGIKMNWYNHFAFFYILKIKITVPYGHTTHLMSREKNQLADIIIPEQVFQTVSHRLLVGMGVRVNASGLGILKPQVCGL